MAHTDPSKLDRVVEVNLSIPIPIILLRIVPERTKLRGFEDSCSAYIDVWGRAEFLLSNCDEVLELGPICDICLDKFDVVDPLEELFGIVGYP